MILDYRRCYESLRDTWQARILEYSTGKLNRVVQSILAHSYPDAIETLFHVVYPGFRSITLPFYCSAGRIMKNGQIAADLATATGVVKRTLVFANEAEMTAELRRLADALKLPDDQRVEMFKVARSWIVCDYRQPLEGAELEDFIGQRTGK